jgi:phosphonate degradation associated HDIG domain protein
MSIDPQFESQAVEELVELYEGRARRRYGLAHVDQLAHAVQSASHARARELPAALIVAALLHDVGHMVHDLGEHPAAAGIDDRHEHVGADWLALRFGPAVVEPVRLHVEAKRYLCATDAGYAGRLTPDSIESLALQGGPMNASETKAFEARPFATDAVTLRLIDDLAKDPAGPCPAFGDFRHEIVLALREAARPGR